MVRHFSELDQRSLFGHGKSEHPSLLGLSGMTDLLHELLGERRFEDLNAPYAVTAVDVNYGHEIVLKNGRVLDAILATIAVPGVFPPRRQGEYLLVDGGLSNPVPVDVVKELLPGVPSVAVILSSLPEEKIYLPDQNIFGPLPMFERITRLRVAQAFNVFLRSLDVSSRLLSEMRLEIDKPEVVIRPDLLNIGFLEVVDVEQVVAIGRAAAENALDDLYRAVGWQRKFIKRLGMDGLLEKIKKRRKP
jgi:NTE family protein